MMVETSARRARKTSDIHTANKFDLYHFETQPPQRQKNLAPGVKPGVTMMVKTSARRARKAWDTHSHGS